MFESFRARRQAYASQEIRNAAGRWTLPHPIRGV